MCTVTFLPLPQGGYLLGTNRDESPTRGPALPPGVSHLAGRALLFPTDTDAGGTWIAVDEDGRSLCVLNGDRPPAAAPPARPLSRGLLLLQLMAAPDADDVHAELQRRAAAGALACKPFQLLVATPGTPSRITSLTWDGATLTSSDHGDAALFVSSSFEPDAVLSRRAVAFAPLAQLPRSDPAALRAAQSAFHRGHAPGLDEGDAYSVCMHRPDAHSRSFTTVEVADGRVTMSHVGGQPCGHAPAVRLSLDGAPAG